MFDCIALSLLVLLVATFAWGRRRKRENQPPGPTGLPLLGYVPFLGKFPPRTYYDLSKKCGSSVISVNMGNKNFVILNDYESIREALVKQGDNFSGRLRTIFVKNINQGYGILSRDYDEGFVEQRKFALKTLRRLGVGKRNLEDRITEEIEYFVDSLSQKRGQPFNCLKLIAAAVSNVTCNVILGERFTYDDKEFQQLVADLNTSVIDKVYSACMTILIFLPVLRYIPPVSHAYAHIQEMVSRQKKMFTRIVEDHKKTMQPGCPRDFIDEYLEEMEKNHGKPSSFVEKQLLQLVRDFFMAGTETTATTIRWSILLFAHRPDIQNKVFQEIDSVIGSSVPSVNHRDELHYTLAVIHELMRHRTLAPISMPHRTTQPVSFRGFDIPENTTIVANLWAVHHDPDNFEDPDEFRPERFLDDNGKFIKNRKLIPFSIGPRSCLGEQLATMEVFLFITTIVQRFKIMADPEQPLPSFDSWSMGIVYTPREFKACFVPRE